MKVIDRRLQWGLGSSPELRKASVVGGAEALLPYAYAALAEYCGETHYGAVSYWGKGWGDKYSTYAPYGPKQQVIGTYKDVPAPVIHSIMCRMR